VASELLAMKTVYISTRGDDKNDGAIDKPIYSWKRAKEIGLPVGST
jgi:hypothetical protein